MKVNRQFPIYGQDPHFEDTVDLFGGEIEDWSRGRLCLRPPPRSAEANRREGAAENNAVQLMMMDFALTLIIAVCLGVGAFFILTNALPLDYTSGSRVCDRQLPESCRRRAAR